MTAIQIRSPPRSKKIRAQQHRLPDTPHGPCVSYRRLSIAYRLHVCASVGMREYATWRWQHPRERRNVFFFVDLSRDAEKEIAAVSQEDNDWEQRRSLPRRSALFVSDKKS